MYYRTSFWLLVAASVLLLGCPTSEIAGLGQNSGSDNDETDARVRPAQDTGVNTNDVGLTPDAGNDASDDGSIGGDTQEEEDLGSNGLPNAVAAQRIDGQVDIPVTFDGTASTDPDGIIVAYSWDFGDGSESEQGALLAHSFEYAGVFPASLTVEDDDGNTDVAEIEVRINSTGNAPPIAIITTPDLPIPLGAEVEFNGLLSGDTDGLLVALEWTFTRAGTDEVEMASGATVMHTFSQVGDFEVLLEVTDNNDAVGSEVVVVEVVNAPIADIVASTTTVNVGDNVDFDGSASTSDAEIIGYVWDFGDEGTADGATVSHNWASPGNYSVSLTVTDAEDATGRAEVEIIVIDTGGAPVARAGDDLTGSLSTTFSFDGTASSDDVAITAWRWDFGDGASATTPIATHQYTTAATYTATLTVSDADSNVATDTLDVTINAGPVPVISVVTANPDSEAPVEFSSAGSYDPEGDSIVGYLWTFGDAGTSTEVDPSHTYASGGVYTVSLTLTDEFGSSGTASVAVSVTCNGSGCTVDGDYHLTPFDDEEVREYDCNAYFFVIIQPSDCTMLQSGTNLTMTCGSLAYSGTINAGSFDISMSTLFPDDGWCGDLTYSDRLTGTFVSETRWEGLSHDRRWEWDWSDVDSDCGACYWDGTFQVTATKL